MKFMARAEIISANTPGCFLIRKRSWGQDYGFCLEGMDHRITESLRYLGWSCHAGMLQSLAAPCKQELWQGIHGQHRVEVGSGDGSLLPLHLKLDFADGLQKLCVWGNFLLCLWILGVVVTSSALLFILQVVCHWVFPVLPMW